MGSDQMMEEISIPTERGEIIGRAAGDRTAPLVLGIHGWSQANGWHTWAPLIEPLATAGYFALTIDMPGWGKSPAWKRVVGKTAIVALLDQLEIETAHALMGKSWGGGVALDFAQNQSARVKKLILTAPSYQGELSALAKMPQPVQLVWAEDDPTIPYRYASNFTDAAPNWEFVSYQTGGHSAAMENAEDFAPKAIDFLSRS